MHTVPEIKTRDLIIFGGYENDGDVRNVIGVTESLGFGIMAQQRLGKTMFLMGPPSS